MRLPGVCLRLCSFLRCLEWRGWMDFCINGRGAAPGPSLRFRFLCYSMLTCYSKTLALSS